MPRRRSNNSAVEVVEVVTVVGAVVAAEIVADMGVAEAIVDVVVA